MSQEVLGLKTREIWFCFWRQEKISQSMTSSLDFLLTDNLVYKICLWKNIITDAIHCELVFSKLE